MILAVNTVIYSVKVVVAGFSDSKVMTGCPKLVAWCHNGQ